MMQWPQTVQKTDVYFLTLLVVMIGLFYFVKTYPPRSALFLKSEARQELNQLPIQQRNPAMQTTARQQQVVEQVNLQTQLLVERQNLTRLQEDLEALKAQQIQEQQKLSLEFPARTSQNYNDIQQLSQAFQENQRAASQVDDLASRSLQEQSTSERLARDQIDYEIQTAEANLQQTIALINYWQTSQLPTPEQQNQLTDLLNDFTVQRQNLDYLRQQKVNLSSQVLAQTRAINQAAIANKADINATQDQIQDQIISLQNEISQIQTAQNQIRVSSKTLDQKIREAQNSYDQQLTKVKEIETSLNNMLEINRIQNQQTRLPSQSPNSQ